MIGTSEARAFELLSFAQYIYRNVVLVALFGFFLFKRTDGLELLELTELVLLLSIVLATLGFLHYLGLFDSNIFDRYSQITEELLDAYFELGAGTGFAGMFRGAVGQIFAMIGIVSLAYAVAGPKEARLKPIALAIVLASFYLIVRSYSRSGLVGLAVGCMLISLVFVRRLAAITLFGAAAAYLAMTTFSDVQIFERFFGSNLADADKLSSGRLSGWDAALDAFSEHPKVLLVGVGAGNDDGVADLIGLWGAHNEYLDVIFKLGAYALLFYGAALYNLFKASWTGFFSSSQAFNASLVMLALIISNCLVAFTQGHLYHAHATYTTTFMVFFLYGAHISRILSNRAMS